MRGSRDSSRRVAGLAIGLLLVLSGCSQGSAASTAPTAAPSVAPTASPVITPSPTIAAPTPTPTPTLAPSDLPFTIDCSALPVSRKVDCSAFIAATRDVVYPIERELTGGSLSQCYKEIQYKILPTDPGANAGGYSSGAKITYNQRYSVDLPHRYDVHEILHSISTCAHALDSHVFHGMIMNAVYDRLGVHEAGYFESRSAQNLNLGLENLMAQAAKASGAELANSCLGVLQRKITIAYFDLGASAITPLYRSTIAPLKNTTAPDAKALAIWGASAQQIEALRETLQRDFKYSLGVPACGL